MEPSRPLENVLVTTRFNCKSAFMFVAKRSQGTFRFSFKLAAQYQNEHLIENLPKKKATKK
jgi:hypothetical protein